MFVGANGCDSTIFTTLSVIPHVGFEQTVTICQGASFSAGTNTYNSSGVYYDTLVASNGCDSVVTTNLFVESTLYASVFESICFGTAYNFNGNNLTATGSYVDTLSAVAGCDSVVTLFLNVEPQVTSSYTTTICNGQSVTHGTQTLTASGAYPETFTTVDGCDSIVTLYLVVTPSIDSTIIVDICLGDTYTLGTQTLSNSGIYTENFTTAAGCDSVVTLELNVLDCEALLEISNICTPNDDGKNDTWRVSDLNQITGCTVEIFNRWGQKLYSTDNYQNDWDGTREGEILPDGTYYYVISCEEDRMYQGVINLMRFKK